MCWILSGLMVGMFLLGMAGQVGAQDFASLQNSAWRTLYPPNIERLDEYLFKYDICAEDFFAANQDVLGDGYSHFSRRVVADSLWHLEIRNVWSTIAGPFYIPEHDSCYQAYHAPQETWTALEQQLNICVEEFYYPDRPVSFHKETIYIRHDAPLCVNEKGQRLQYYASFWYPLDEPYYSEDRFTRDAQDWGRYCVDDMARANPGWYKKLGYSFSLESWVPDVNLFVPENAKLCRPVESLGKDLYQISQDENICIETILEASTVDLFEGKQANPYIQLMAPVDAPPCYDDKGVRLNTNDKHLYKPQAPQSFLDIARQYDVCPQNLWQANPALKSWSGLYYFLPDVIFIPDAPSCDFSSITFTAEPDQTLYAVSLLTNVCMNRLIEANPQYPQLETIGWTGEFKQSLTLVIPQRYPCYKLYLNETEYGYDYGTGYIFDYLCYPVAITPASDFTGHNPPITASDDASLPYCEPRSDGMTVFYENVPYTLYKMKVPDTMITMGQCFGVDPYDLIALNARNIPETVRPAEWILIPQPHAQDCWMLMDVSLYSQRYREMTYKAGYLIDGVYTVNYNDTLGSIGRMTGYLPQSIAEANNLPDPDTIYYLQELKMPSYPSLYTLVPIGGAGGVVVLASTAIYGLRRRHMGKKKNTDTK